MLSPGRVRCRIVETSFNRAEYRTTLRGLSKGDLEFAAHEMSLYSAKLKGELKDRAHTIAMLRERMRILGAMYNEKVGVLQEPKIERSGFVRYNLHTLLHEPWIMRGESSWRVISKRGNPAVKSFVTLSLKADNPLIKEAFGDAVSYTRRRVVRCSDIRTAVLVAQYGAASLLQVDSLFPYKRNARMYTATNPQRVWVGGPHVTEKDRP